MNKLDVVVYHFLGEMPWHSKLIHAWFVLFFTFFVLFTKGKERKFYLCILSFYVLFRSVDFAMLGYNFNYIDHVFMALTLQFSAFCVVTYLFDTSISKIQSMILFNLCLIHFLQIVDLKASTSIVYNNYEILISALMLSQIMGSHDRTIAVVSSSFGRIQSMLPRGYLYSNRLSHFKK